MNIPKGYKLVPVQPTVEMCKAALADDCWDNMNPPPEVAYRAMLAVAPTPPAQDNNKAIADYNEPAMESSWQYLKTQLDSKGWTTGEAFTYRGFFAWGWEARRQHHAPPAQENQWQEAVLNECMTIEGCYTEVDPVGTVKCLIDWHVRNTANWTKDATPPAQEDEPVLWYEAEESTRDKDIRHVIGSMLYSTRLSVTKPEASNPVWPLYTRPDNDGMRKAAERADTSLETLLYRVAEGIDHLPLTESIRAIRKTLRDALKEK